MGKPEIGSGTPLGGIALELGLVSALRQRLLTQRWCRRQYISIFMRRNNKAERKFNVEKYKLMDFQNVRFCNAKFGFNGLLPIAVRWPIAVVGCVPAPGRHVTRACVEHCRRLITRLVFRAVGKITATVSGEC
jgi:hypothetical protein